jgi:hypothetical protein
LPQVGVDLSSLPPPPSANAGAASISPRVNAAAAKLPRPTADIEHPINASSEWSVS